VEAPEVVRAGNGGHRVLERLVPEETKQ
jgi:hypothetical protein